MPQPEQLHGINECVEKIVTDVGVYKAYLITDGKQKKKNKKISLYGPYWYFWPKKRRGEFAYYFGRRKPNIYGKVQKEWKKYAYDELLERIME